MSEKLRQAAQFLLTAVEDEGVRGMDTAIKALRDALAEDALVRLSETHQQLGEALELGETEPVTLYVRDDEYEYDKWGELEFIGCIDGTHGGRWVLTVKDKAAVWPEGTAVYVRKVKR